MASGSTFEGFTPVESVPLDGYFIDFLGVKTRVSYFDEKTCWLSGKVFGLPEPDALIFFEYEEWEGVMAALREAENRFTCMELGCGWGPWLAICEAAAKMRGIDSVDLIGVEADHTQLGYLRTHFRDNGIDPERHTIIQAAIDDHDAPSSPQHPGGAPLLALGTLLSNHGLIDLIHCDIQFAESRAFRKGIDAVTKHVKRVVVGTHSRKIEDELIETFVDAGWRMEFETPCKYVIGGGRPNLLADGAQVWKNVHI